MSNPQLKFDIENVNSVEFGVGQDEDNEEVFVAVPVDEEVQNALLEMVQITWTNMIRKKETSDTAPSPYEPSERYESMEYIYLPVGDTKAELLLNLHTASNLRLDHNVLSEPEKVFCYFVRMTDNIGQNLTAMRRASQFKGVLKNQLISSLDDTLRIIKDKVFKLDHDFDLLVDSQYIHILRPSGFEYIGKLKQAILDAVPTSISKIQRDIDFVNWEPIQQYAMKHPRAARYLASISTFDRSSEIEKNRLLDLCRHTGVDVEELNGKILVKEKLTLDFLKIVDRRLYWIELTGGSLEVYEASSRRKTH